MIVSYACANLLKILSFSSATHRIISANKVQGGQQKKGNPLLVSILSCLYLEVINFSVYILFGNFIYLYIRGEEIVENDARMSLLRLFEHI